MTHQLKIVQTFLACLFFLSTQEPLLSSEVSEEVWPPQTVRWTLKDGKELIFVATHHTDNIISPIHGLIKAIVEKEKPDIYVMEGFSSDEDGISPERLSIKAKKLCEDQGKCGENLYTALLATQKSIPFIGADLTEDKQLEPLLQKGFSFDDIVFFMLVQHLPYFFRDGYFETHTIKFIQQNREAMCNDFLQTIIASWIKCDVKLTYQDFLEWWEKHFKAPLDMDREFSDWWTGNNYAQPHKSKDALYTQQIAYWFNKNRDDHLMKVIQDNVSKHKRTLVVYGSNHLRDLWNRLIKAYGPPNFTRTY